MCESIQASSFQAAPGPSHSEGEGPVAFESTTAHTEITHPVAKISLQRHRPPTNHLADGDVV